MFSLILKREEEKEIERETLIDCVPLVHTLTSDGTHNPFG